MNDTEDLADALLAAAVLDDVDVARAALADLAEEGGDAAGAALWRGPPRGWLGRLPGFGRCHFVTLSEDAADAFADSHDWVTVAGRVGDDLGAAMLWPAARLNLDGTLYALVFDAAPRRLRESDDVQSCERMWICESAALPAGRDARRLFAAAKRVGPPLVRDVWEFSGGEEGLLCESAGDLARVLRLAQEAVRGEAAGG